MERIVSSQGGQTGPAAIPGERLSLESGINRRGKVHLKPMDSKP